MVDNYIKEVLFEHGKVYVPNLGLIFKNTSSQNHSEDPYTISQPTYSLAIDQEYKNEEDTWLLYATARGERVSLGDAYEVIKHRVDEINLELNESREAKIHGVGTIASDDGRLTFANSLYSQDVEDADDNFGIPAEIHVNPEERDEVVAIPPSYSTSEIQPQEEYTPITSNPVLEQNQGVNENDSQVYEEERSNSTTYILIAAGVILFLLLGWGGYYFLSEPELEIDEVATTEEVTKTDVADKEVSPTAPTEEENNSAANVPEGIPLAVKEKGKRYYIITGSFTINENAQKLKRQLKTQGVKAKILEPKENTPLYRVSLADFDEFNDALTKIEVLKQTHGNSIWILKY